MVRIVQKLNFNYITSTNIFKHRVRTIFTFSTEKQNKFKIRTDSIQTNTICNNKNNENENNKLYILINL